MNGQKTHEIYAFGAFRIDADERLLRRGGEIVRLPPKVVDLLLVLVASGGRVLTKDELMRRIWADSFVEETNLTHNISLLRRTLGEKNGGANYIETIPRRGYRFVAEVRQPTVGDELEIIAHERTTTSVYTEEELEISDDGARNAKQISAPPKNGRTFSAFSASLAGLFALAIILAVAGFVWRQNQQNKSAAASSNEFQITSIRRLTTNGKVPAATLSPDGKLYVYTVREGELTSLWLNHVDGGEPVNLRPPAKDTLFPTFTFSPDGKFLYYAIQDEANPRGTLYRMPALGGVSEKVFEGVNNSIRFAPDGKHFATLRMDAAARTSNLVIISTDGKTERVVASRPSSKGFVGKAVFSPDASQIAVGAPSDETDAKFEIYLVNVADGAMKPLTDLNWNRIYSLFWLADSSGLIAIAADSELWENNQLWFVAYPSGAARRISNDLASYGSSLVASKDSSAMIAVQHQQMSNIWLAPADDFTKLRQITFGAFGRNDGLSGLDFAMDGRIFYTALTGQSQSVWVMDADGGNARQITPGGFIDSAVSVPLDASFAVFDSNRSGGFEVWRVRTDGTDLRQLTVGGGNTAPHVSPDGKWIVFRSAADGALWRISSDGGNPVRLTNAQANWARISPDSKFVACSYGAEGKTKLTVISIEGGEPLKSFDAPRTANFRYGIRWLPDGAGLAYRDWTDGIWRQNLAGGEPQKLDGLPAEKIYAFGWSPDGKQFAFVRGTEIRDVVLISNLK